MKQIAKYLKEFIKEDFNAWAYIYVLIFLTVIVFVNYKIDYEDSFLDIHYGKWKCAFYYMATYCFGYYGIIIPILFIKKKQHLLIDYRFWLKSLVILAFMSAERGFNIFKHFEGSFNNFNENYFIHKILVNLKSLVFYIPPLLILKVFFDRKEAGFYGLRKKGFFPKPFLLMLFIVLPLVVWASFQKDFLNQYPIFKAWYINPVFNLSRMQMTGIFVMAYGIDFVMTELVFRGALVIGMSAILGKEAVMAMAGLYVVIHFGKPAAETISSFFGGYILGVIAYYYRNIIGGCIIHLGLAYMMEAGAFLQLIVFKK